MFLKWIAKCDLLSNHDENYIMKPFSTICQRELCTSTLSYLSALSNHEVNVAFPSRKSISWILQITGHCFSLDMKDKLVISQALNVYEQWLMVHPNNIDGRPDALVDQEQLFIQQMIGHMTLLFLDRRDNADGVEAHIELCLRALEMLVRVAGIRGRSLSRDTWDKLLRSMIGLADCLLHGNKSIIGSRMCWQITRAVFEIFLRGLQRNGPNPDIWKTLTKFCKRWNHRRRVLEQWNCMLLTLTNLVVQKLYHHGQELVDEETKSGVFSIVWADQYTSTFRLNDTLTSYAWYRTLHLIGHPSHIHDPEVHAVVMNGIARIGEIFIKAYSTQCPSLAPVQQWSRISVENEAVSLHPRQNHEIEATRIVNDSEKAHTAFSMNRLARPDANSILRVLGPWLFDATLNRSIDFSIGRAQAIKVLGRIICDHGGGNSKRLSGPNSIRFLLTLTKALHPKESDRVIASAISSCTGIFGINAIYTLRAGPILAGFFYQAIERLLRSSCMANDGEDANTSRTVGGVRCNVLRKSCYKLLASLVAVHGQLQNEKILQMEEAHLPEKFQDSRGKWSEYPSYNPLDAVDMLVLSLATDPDPLNQQIIMWALYQSFAMLHRTYGHTIATHIAKVVTTICGEVNSSVNRWNLPVIFTAFEVLSNMVSMHAFIQQECPKCLANIVIKTCQFILNRLENLTETISWAYKSPDALIQVALNCLIDWITECPFILNDSVLNGRVVQVAVMGADLRNEMFDGISSTRSAARLLLNLICRHRHMASNRNSTNRSASFAEKSFLRIESLSHQLFHQARFFLLNDSKVLSIIEYRDEDLRSATIVTIRDETGKFCWQVSDARCTTKPYEATKLNLQALPIADDDSTDPLQISMHDAMNDLNVSIADPTMPSSRNNSNDSPDDDEKMFVDLLQAQSNLERKAEKSLAASHALLESKDQHSLAWHTSRQVLTTLGMFSIENWGELQPIIPNDVFMETLKVLDNIPDRDIIKCAVLHVESVASVGGHDSVKILNSASESVPYQSDLYMNFLLALGWPTDPGSNSETLDAQLVNTSYQTEIRYNVPTMVEHNVELSSLEPDITVIWSTCQQSIDPNSVLWQSINLIPPQYGVFIIVEPLYFDLCRVRVFHDFVSVYADVEALFAETLPPTDDVNEGRLFGPLMSNIVMRQEVVGKFIEQSITRVAKAYQIQTQAKYAGTWETTTAKRVNAISQICKQFSTPFLPGELYTHLYCAAESRREPSDVQ